MSRVMLKSEVGHYPVMIQSSNPNIQAGFFIVAGPARAKAGIDSVIFRSQAKNSITS